jgi:hypothetical protein
MQRARHGPRPNDWREPSGARMWAAFGKRMTRKVLIAAIGWKPADIRHALRLVEIEERGAQAGLMDEIMKRHQQTEKTAARAVLARRQS